MKWWQRLLINTLTFLALAGFIGGFYIDTWFTAVIAAVIFGVLNAILKPIIVILSLPITLLTLGLFYIVINGFMLWLVSVFVGGFGFSSFWVAVLVSIVVSLLNMYFNSETRKYD